MLTDAVRWGLGALLFLLAPMLVSEADAQEQRGQDWMNAELVFDTAGRVKLRDGKSGELCIAPSDGEMACGQDLVARNPTAEAYGGVELQRVVAADLVPSLPGDEFVLEFSGNTTGGNYTGTIYLFYRLDGDHRPVRMGELQFDKYMGQTVTEARVVRGRLEVRGLLYKEDDPGCCPSMGFEETYSISPKKGGFVMRKGPTKTWRLPTEGDGADGPDREAQPSGQTSAPTSADQAAPAIAAWNAGAGQRADLEAYLRGLQEKLHAYALKCERSKRKWADRMITGMGMAVSRSEAERYWTLWPINQDIRQLSAPLAKQVITERLEYAKLFAAAYRMIQRTGERDQCTNAIINAYHRAGSGCVDTGQPMDIDWIHGAFDRECLPWLYPP